MKKIKLIPLLLTPISTMGLATVASCGKQTDFDYDEIGQKIYDTAMEKFMEISKIPHCSNEEGHEDSLVAIRNYFMDVAKEAKAQNIQTDDAGNVWYDIPASEGCKDYKNIIFQGHMDMVWKAKEGTEAETWNQWTHPIAEPVIETDDKGVKIIHSKDYMTTLGADDGMATALMLSLAINKDIFPHGKIRCIFTANEENGYPGAEALGKRKEAGDIIVINHEEGFDYLVNFDTGPLGSVIFNSGGGYTGHVVVDTKNVKETKPLYTLEIKDTLGGHSAIDINKGRANPLQLVSEGLYELINNEAAIGLVSYETDGTRTSIPTNAKIGFTSSMTYEQMEPIINAWFEKVKDAYQVEENMKMELVSASTTDYHMEVAQSNLVIIFVTYLPFGPLEFFPAPEEDVVKCSASIGPILYQSAENAKLDLMYTGRFNVKQDEDRYIVENDTILKLFINQMGGDPTTLDSGHWYPWMENDDSKIMNICLDAYKEIGVAGHKARVHGGIECADFIAQNNNLTQISIGANLYDEHAVTETLDLDSWLLSCKLLAKMCGKMNF